MSVARLRWCQPALLQGQHELRAAGDQVLGTLRFQPKPAVTWVYTDRRLAVAELDSGQWEFSVQRKGLSGLLGLSATVPIAGTDSGDVAAGAFFFTGTLQLTTGRRFQWRAGPARGGPSAFLANTGELLIRFDTGSFFDRVNTYIDVQPGASELPERRLLVALGLYLRLAANKVYR